MLVRHCGWLAVACVASALASGCLHLSSTPQPKSERKCQRSNGVLVHPSRIAEYKAAKEARQYDKALAVAREEIASPAVPANELYMAALYTLGIQALAEVAHESGATAAMDAEAMRYHDSASAMCLEELERGKLANAMAIYYSKSRRNGIALKWIYDERLVWAAGHDEYRRIIATDSLATIYGDMGQLEMRDKNRAEALAAARTYFGKPGDPTAPEDANQWVGYLEMLKKHMGDVARGDLDELAKTWEIARPIADRFATPKYASYSLAALYFAIAGDATRASELAKKARALGAGERAKIPRADADITCQEALIAVAEHQYVNAGPIFDSCLALRTQFKLGDDDPAVLAGRGVMNENIGKLDEAAKAYDAAILIYEGMRGSYDVGARGSFFANPVFQKSYHGRLRVLVRRAEKDPTAVVGALQAADALRARQLGDTLAAKGQQVKNLADLASLRARLGPDDAIVSYTMLDTSFALIVVTRESASAKLVDYDSVGLNAHVKAARDGLTRPDGDAKALATELDALASVFAKPAATMIGTKRRLIVLPDGLLNTIPYELLAARGVGKDVTVTLTPSIAYFVSAPPPAGAGTEKKSFFGLGDPNYPAAIHVAGIPDSAIGRVVIPRLPETRQEVTGIASQLGSDASKVLLGADATPAAVQALDLSRFRFVHFATHGVLGGDVPGIDEPSLVLAANEDGDPFLRASDATKLKLDADLTVLSACNTGSGKYVTGEGVLGMSRAFLLAGSRAVVMSLWAVDSQATERLMTLFYDNVAKGNSVPVALRRAKATLQGIAHDAKYDDRALVLDTAASHAPIRADKQAMAHPYFWSAFVLVGGPDR